MERPRSNKGSERRDAMVNRTHIMRIGRGWYWEVVSEDSKVIARGIADTQDQARAESSKVLSADQGTANQSVGGLKLPKARRQPLERGKGRVRSLSPATQSV